MSDKIKKLSQAQPSSHTPEPWHANGSQIVGRRGKRIQYIADVSRDYSAATCEANAARIVACVNACCELADPATAIYNWSHQKGTP